jgi:hypothetical protein
VFQVFAPEEAVAEPGVAEVLVVVGRTGLGGVVTARLPGGRWIGGDEGRPGPELEGDPAEQPDRVAQVVTGRQEHRGAARGVGGGDGGVEGGGVQRPPVADGAETAHVELGRNGGAFRR